MRTDSTYFVADLYIDGATVGQFDNAELSKASELARQIAIFEPDILKQILGTDLYAEYLASETTATPAWTEFKAKLWDATNFVSPVANYVFFRYWPTYCIRATGAGAFLSVKEDVTTVSVADKQRMVWNSMVPMLVEFFDWLDENRADYEHDDITLDQSQWCNLTTYQTWF